MRATTKAHAGSEGTLAANMLGVNDADPDATPRAGPLDVGAAPASSAAVTTTYTDTKLSSMRKTIAKRLLHSKTTVPHRIRTPKVSLMFLSFFFRVYNTRK